jgi:hypothetical protein
MIKELAMDSSVYQSQTPCIVFAAITMRRPRRFIYRDRPTNRRKIWPGA